MVEKRPLREPFSIKFASMLAQPTTEGVGRGRCGSEAEAGGEGDPGLWRSKQSARHLGPSSWCRQGVGDAVGAGVAWRG